MIAKAEVKLKVQGVMLELGDGDHWREEALEVQEMGSMEQTSGWHRKLWRAKESRVEPGVWVGGREEWWHCWQLQAGTESSRRSADLESRMGHMHGW